MIDHNIIMFYDVSDIDIIILDKSNQSIHVMSDGKLTDMTKQCKTMYNRNKATGSNRKLGTIWFDYIINGICFMNYNDKSLIYAGNDVEAMSGILLEKRIYQLEKRLERCKRDEKRLNEGKQIYTYRFSR